MATQQNNINNQNKTIPVGETRSWKDLVGFHGKCVVHICGNEKPEGPVASFNIGAWQPGNTVIVTKVG
jgi:hypothetical protein